MSLLAQKHLFACAALVTALSACVALGQVSTKNAESQSITAALADNSLLPLYLMAPPLVVIDRERCSSKIRIYEPLLRTHTHKTCS